VTEDARIVVADAPERERFEVTVDGEPAGFLVYHSRKGRKGLLALVHTEVEDGFEGRGLGGRLARFALDQAREDGLAVLPFCPFVNGWIKRHPEYTDLVPPAYRANFDL
jgi:predicted GNAT family acetyltransferase